VRTEREKQSIAQDQFALIAHVDRSYYGKLERGERQPSLALMLRIAKALGTPASELLAKVETELLRR
jgi:transcriptional regulator with XRE-family HTH domain